MGGVHRHSKYELGMLVALAGCELNFVSKVGRPRAVDACRWVVGCRVPLGCVHCSLQADRDKTNKQVSATGLSAAHGSMLHYGVALPL